MGAVIGVALAPVAQAIPGPRAVAHGAVELRLVAADAATREALARFNDFATSWPTRVVLALAYVALAIFVYRRLSRAQSLQALSARWYPALVALGVLVALSLLSLTPWLSVFAFLGLGAAWITSLATWLGAAVVTTGNGVGRLTSAEKRRQHELMEADHAQTRARGAELQDVIDDIETERRAGDD